jgi:acetyl esterase/lipase
MRIILLSLSLCLLKFVCLAQSARKDSKDIVYAEVDGKQLLLDLYLPAAKTTPYLIVWVHGGAWHSGSKESPPLKFVESGYALASINYRLSVEAKFPAPIHDIKAAIRFLRANATKYGFRADKIIIAGSSAGGHLAALVGVSNNDKELEGTVGQHTTTSSSVQCILDYYGPTNFVSILKQSTPHGISVRGPAMALLLGKTVESVPEIAKKASPVFQVDGNDPPLLMLHGDQDIQVPISQSHELEGAYKNNNLKVKLVVVYGAGHGDATYFDAKYHSEVEAFLKESLAN